MVSFDQLSRCGYRNHLSHLATCVALLLLVMPYAASARGINDGTPYRSIPVFGSNDAHLDGILRGPGSQEVTMRTLFLHGRRAAHTEPVEVTTGLNEGSEEVLAHAVRALPGSTGTGPRPKPVMEAGDPSLVNGALRETGKKCRESLLSVPLMIALANTVQVLNDRKAE